MCVFNIMDTKKNSSASGRFGIGSRVSQVPTEMHFFELADPTSLDCLLAKVEKLVWDLDDRIRK